MLNIGFWYIIYIQILKMLMLLSKNTIVTSLLVTQGITFLLIYA